MMSYQEHSTTYTHAGTSKSLAYISAGPQEGPLLIFVHGWPDLAIEWTNQIDHFSKLGYRVIAPDLPGSGRSTARRVASDYSMESITDALRALLSHLGRSKAVWIGHDWGSGVVSTLCNTSPELVSGVVFISVPYHTLDMGMEALMEHVNREIYPKEKYPWAQWSYQVHYVNDFEGVTAFYDSEPAGWQKLCHRAGDPANLYKPAHSATAAEDGGPGGGPSVLPKPPPPEKIQNSVLTGEKLEKYTEAYKKTGFWGTNALYLNHEANRAYNVEQGKNGGRLEFPVLFVEGKYDVVCAVATTTICEPMRRLCPKLTEVTIESGHWVPVEKAEECNNAIEGWLGKELGGVKGL